MGAVAHTEFASAGNGIWHARDYTDGGALVMLFGSYERRSEINGSFLFDLNPGQSHEHGGFS